MEMNRQVRCVQHVAMDTCSGAQRFRKREASGAAVRARENGKIDVPATVMVTQIVIPKALCIIQRR